MSNYNSESFEEAVKPAIKWLNENANPHSSIEITTVNAELKSGELLYSTLKND